MKLTLKLTLAFLLVSMIAISLAAVFISVTTSVMFKDYLVDQRHVEFVAATTEYYQATGDWSGVDAVLRSRGLLPPLTKPGDKPPDPQPFVLVGTDGTVIISGGQYQQGQKIQQEVVDQGTPIMVDGKVVGTVITTGQNPLPNIIEKKYIDSVNHSLLIAAIGGAVLAFILGSFIARSLAHPVRELTSVTRLLAQGKLEQRVLVRSSDELGELAAAFNQMSEDLVRLNQSRRQMTADIAHDLRNPLAVVGGYLEELQSGKLEPSPERYEVMLTEVQHLQHLVEDLRILSLADSGELLLHLQSMSPAELIVQTAAVYQQRAESLGIRIETDFANGLPEVQMDPERMEQVLGNLVSNALCYTPAGGMIRLSAQLVEGKICIEVKDTGSGIAPEVMPHIFDRSYRGDPARGGSGSGLGLAIASSIVELHGGSIGVSSQGAGQGSTFSITIPID